MYLVYHKCLTKYLHGFTLMEVNRRKEEQNGNGEGGASLPLKSQQINSIEKGVTSDQSSNIHTSEGQVYGVRSALHGTHMVSRETRRDYALLP